jgi:hypothetical protein
VDDVENKHGSRTMTDAPELKPCPFCRGTDVRIDAGGQIWRGQGYSDPQFYHLHHNGRLPSGDGFQTCYVNLRVRTEAEAIAAWNTRALRPDTKGQDT